jgi:hypothetical protein
VVAHAGVPRGAAIGGGESLTGQDANLREAVHNLALCQHTHKAGAILLSWSARETTCCTRPLITYQ